MHNEGSTADPVAAFFGNGLSHEAELPLRWTPSAPDTAPARGTAETNVRLLQAVSQLDERMPSADEADPQEIEIARLHAKVDLLIGAVGALLRQSQVLPPTVGVRLSADRIAWQGSGAQGQGHVDLYLHPAFIQPLRLEVRVAGMAGDWALGILEGLGEAEQFALERHIFLLHRRQVAERRARSRMAPGRP